MNPYPCQPDLNWETGLFLVYLFLSLLASLLDSQSPLVNNSPYIPEATRLGSAGKAGRQRGRDGASLCAPFFFGETMAKQFQPQRTGSGLLRMCGVLRTPCAKRTVRCLSPCMRGGAVVGPKRGSQPSALLQSNLSFYCEVRGLRRFAAGSTSDSRPQSAPQSQSALAHRKTSGRVDSGDIHGGWTRVWVGRRRRRPEPGNFASATGRLGGAVSGSPLCGSRTGGSPSLSLGNCLAKPVWEGHQLATASVALNHRRTTQCSLLSSHLSPPPRLLRASVSRPLAIRLLARPVSRTQAPCGDHFIHSSRSLMLSPDAGAATNNQLTATRRRSCLVSVALLLARSLAVSPVGQRLCHCLPCASSLAVPQRRPARAEGADPDTKTSASLQPYCPQLMTCA